MHLELGLAVGGGTVVARVGGWSQDPTKVASRVQAGHDQTQMEGGCKREMATSTDTMTVVARPDL